MSRRALILTLTAALALLALAWLGRERSGLDRPAGVSPPGTVDPRFRCTLTSIPPTPRVGELFRIKLDIAGDVALNEEEGTLLLGFPHPYYALRPERRGEPYPVVPPDPARITARTVGGTLPVSVRRTGYGRWYVEVPLERVVQAGRRVELDVPGLRAPNRPLERFEPIVLLDPNGDEDFWRICPTLALPVGAGPPAELVAVVPSRVRPGADIDLTVRQEDAFGNPVGELSGAWSVAWTPIGHEGAAVEAQAALTPLREGVSRVALPAPPVGAWVADVSGAAGRARSNAILVEPGAAPLAWADLHGHSGLSDGWGTPEAWYEHARNVAVLDAAALSDHDWQLDEGELDHLIRATEEANDPPRFVTVPAVELNLLGHEVAYVFDPAALPRGARAEGGATTLWAEADIGYPTARLTPDIEGVLDGTSVELVTVTSIAPSMGTALPPARPLPNWRVIEIYSAHGSSECVDCPRSAWREPSGDDGGWGSVRDALSAGYRLGFIAGGDSHDGRPGTSRWGAQSGGLAAVAWREPSREGLHEALRERRVYGTTGSRPIVDFAVDGVPMGGLVAPAAAHRIRFRVLDSKPVRSALLVRDGVDWKTIEAPRGWVDLEDTDGGAAWWYLRAELHDGNLAWSSPVFVGP